jgi:glutathione S-transferase
LFRGERMPDIKGKVDKMMKELEIWEDYLTDDDYLAGDDMTMVDLVVFPLIAWLVEITKLPIEKKFPSLARWYDDIKDRSCSQKCTEWWEALKELQDKEGVNVLEDME